MSFGSVRSVVLFGMATTLLSLAGCAHRTGYGPFVDHMPKSILVLPPVNHSANVHASDAFLSTVSTPLAEAGYYVYPMAVIDRLFKDNGAPTPGDMHSIALKKIDEVIGPDAVMYIHIKEWTTTYVVFDSSTHVTLEYKLVDTKTGLTLWSRAQQVTQSSSQGQQNIVGMLVSAQIHAIAAAATDGKYERDCAALANYVVFYDQLTGLLAGPRSPRFAQDQELIRKELAAEKTTSPAGQPGKRPS